MTGGAPPPTPAPVVCNTSPLIALSQIGRLDLLRNLFGAVLIPPAVAAEVTPEVPRLPDWVVPTPLARALPAGVVNAPLGAGESESIALAIERNARALILDDRPARRLAHGLGLPVIGTLGILLAAKRRGYLSSVADCVRDLETFHFHVSQVLRARVLRDAGEAP